MSIDAYLMIRLHAAECALHAEIQQEQISHPLADYTPERVARLYQQMQDANRFQHPEQISFNV